MENKKKTDIVRTAITGTINGAEVRIDFERKLATKPETLRGVATVMEAGAAPVEGAPAPMQQVLGSVTIDMYPLLGTTTKNTSGKLPLAQEQALIAALVTEMEAELLAAK